MEDGAEAVRNDLLELRPVPLWKGPLWGRQPQLQAPPLITLLCANVSQARRVTGRLVDAGRGGS